MIILVYENNLMWSSRLVKSLKSLGHVPIVRTQPDPDPAGASVAILNLGDDRFAASGLVGRLEEEGVRTVGHAGHKETGLLQEGKDAGCSLVVSNSTLTFKLAEVLMQVILPV